MEGVRFVQKMFVAGILIVIGVIAGTWKSQQLTRRYELLGKIIDGLSFMENEIYYTRARLDMIARRVADMSEGDAAEFFGSFCEMMGNMEERGAEELWYMAADESFCWPTPLTDKDIEAVSVLGGRLGKTDVAGQCENIKRTCKELAIRRAEAKADIEKKGRLYKTIGAAAGAACAMLVI